MEQLSFLTPIWGRGEEPGAQRQPLRSEPRPRRLSMTRRITMSSLTAPMTHREDVEALSLNNDGAVLQSIPVCFNKSFRQFIERRDPPLTINVLHRQRRILLLQIRMDR